MKSISRRDFLVGLSSLPYAVPLAAQSLGTDDIRALRSRFRGELILPTDAVYPTARLTNNHAFDRYPSIIARAENSNDVAHALEYARSRHLAVAIRSGGHCQAGRSSVDGGMIIDLSKLRAVTVIADQAIVECGSGVRVYEANRETCKQDLALPLGICGDVGVAGLTLGGGYGFLLGVAGLACDSLIGAEVVLADGRILDVNEDSNPELLWALRGAGANFGIVTKLKFKAHRVGAIYGGRLEFPEAKASDAAQLANELSADLPDELSMFTGVLELPDGSKSTTMSLCWSGKATQGQRIIGKLITSRIKPQKNSLKVQSISQLVGRGEGTDGFSCARYGIVKGSLPPSGMDALLHTLGTPAGTARDAAMDSLHGAATRRAPGFSAAPNYSPGLGVGYLVFWKDAAGTAPAEAWTREAWERVRPFTDGAYVNMLGDESSTRVHEAYGSNYARLAQLKRKFDPENVFRSNQNIIPA